MNDRARDKATADAPNVAGGSESRISMFPATSENFGTDPRSVTIHRTSEGTQRMSQRNFLAFDLGAESGRAMLGTLADGTLSLSEQHRFANPTETIDGHLHWN